MKKFKFTLDRIKQYRIQIEEMEKNDLSALRAELAELEEQAEKIKSSIIAKSDELRRLYRKGAYPNEISVANRFLTYKKQTLEMKLGEIEEKNKEIEKKLQDVIEATQEVKKMEKLEEHQLEEYRKAEQKENEHFIEKFFGAKPNAEA